MSNNHRHIHFFASAEDLRVQPQRGALLKRYGDAALESCDVAVVLGGDGALLRAYGALVRQGRPDVPLYGINYGSIGHMMNTPSAATDDLLSEINEATATCVHPLRITATNNCGRQIRSFALNEMLLVHADPQKTVKLRVENVDGSLVHANVQGDGAIVASALGSTGYNASALGVLPPTAQTHLDATTIVTPLNPSPLIDDSLQSFSGQALHLVIRVSEALWRPARVCADNRLLLENAVWAEVQTDTSVYVPLLHKKTEPFEEKVATLRARIMDHYARKSRQLLM